MSDLGPSSPMTPTLHPSLPKRLALSLQLPHLCVRTLTHAIRSLWNASPVYPHPPALTTSSKPPTGLSASLPPHASLLTSPSPHLGRTWYLLRTSKESVHKSLAVQQAWAPGWTSLAQILAHHNVKILILEPRLLNCTMVST